MRISFLNHSTGSGEKAITYILAKKDHKGVIRARVEVLRGVKRSKVDTFSLVKMPLSVCFSYGKQFLLC